jgi:molecular chaperone IbpA
MSDALLVPMLLNEDMAMRTYDFAPLTRSAIGFERMFDLLNSPRGNGNEGYPPYDILQTGDDSFRICLAIAGFSPDDIAITAEQNQLRVSGRKSETDQSQYLYKGISAAAFERHFDLADYVQVDSASFANGLLQIDLVRRIPDAMKPRKIEIKQAKR